QPNDVPAPTPVPGDPALPTTTGAKLDLAVQHMQAGRHVAARAVLKEAIASGAGAPELAELRYRYAETFANTGEHAAAISEFDKVTKEFPRSDWACWSYYRAGESFDKLGKSGKVFYQGATEGVCAKSDAAKEAKKKL
nr:tetratricopeptide repeat protein [Deltaproteobacteria bacterium]